MGAMMSLCVSPACIHCPEPCPLLGLGQDPASVTHRRMVWALFGTDLMQGDAPLWLPLWVASAAAPRPCRRQALWSLVCAISLSNAKPQPFPAKTSGQSPRKGVGVLQGAAGRRDWVEAFWGVTPRAAILGPSPPSARRRVEVRGHPWQVGALPRRVRPARRSP